MAQEFDAQQLSSEFAASLLVCIGQENFDEVVRRNVAMGLYSNVCASHDFCDANMIMAQAMKRLAPSLDDAKIFEDSSLVALWNEAWGLAKRGAFFEFASDGWVHEHSKELGDRLDSERRSEAKSQRGG